jgi:hypothetical protein
VNSEIQVHHANAQQFPELNHGQRRSIATTLAVLDEALCECERWATGREVKSVFYSEYNRLTARQRAKVQSEAAKLREVLLELKDALNLEGKVKDAAQSIWAQCSSLWVDLVHLDTKHLRRYGDLPPSLAEYLDKRVAALIGHVNAISDAMKE